MAVTVLHHDGFDKYATAALSLGLYELVNLVASSGLGSGGARNSGQALRIQATSGGAAGNAYIRKTTSATYTEFVVGFYLYVVSVVVGTNCKLAGAVEGSTSHLNVRLVAAAGPGHDLTIARGTTVLATISGAVTEGVGCYLELVGKVADSGGYYRLYKDGVQIADASSQDTQNGGTGTCDKYDLGNADGQTTNYDYYLDDTYFGTVASAADHLGDVREAVLMPTGAGNTTNFTASTGSNWQNVDDATPNGDTDYNSDATVNDKDTFATSNLPSNGTVYSTKEMLYARKDDAGTKAARTVIRVGSTDYDSGADMALSDQYQYFTKYRTTSPAGGAWVQSDVDAIEIGYKVAA